MLWRDVPGADPSSVWHLQLRAYCRWHPEMPLWFYPWPAGPLDTSDVTPITRLGPGIGAAVCRVCDRYYFGAAAGLLDRPGRP
jgi:hypothetical protein